MIALMYLPYAVFFLVLIVFYIYNNNQRNKTSHIIMFRENDDYLTLILGLSLVPEFSKVPVTASKLSEIKGVYRVDSASNWIRIKKSSNFKWEKLSPEIKKVIKSNFKATLK
jgi:Scaffold protein Nfu/NifU N terminal